MCAAVNARLSFSIARHEPHLAQSPWAIIPMVNDAPLTTLVTEFERQERFDLAGGYAGLIPEFFIYGPLDRYFIGEFERGSLSADRRVFLLGCECGEVGCWPLTCEIYSAAGTVLWHRFAQPHRPQRDYSRFGPFTFDLQQYQQAMAELCADYAARVSPGKIS
jgi:hypothetical protein